MEPAIPIEAIPTLPLPLTRVEDAVLRFYAATGIMPRRFQVEFALAIDSGRDALCIAGTGSGKTLAFIFICFLRPDVIVWIVSPLNYIENQQCEQFRSWGLSAINVNASTLGPQMLKDIKGGKYRVVISSPEAYQDANKLRPALLSPELEDYMHITVVDEAHCITTWGNDFRVAYQRVGDMRVFMRDPDRSPMIAVTATASDSIKAAIVHSLKFRNGYHIENLGNFRDNLRYEVYPMEGSQKAHEEVCKLLPPSTTSIRDVKQTMIFVEDYSTAHAIASAVRKHYGLTGKAARDLVPVYHSLRSDLAKRRIERRFKQGRARILITTEALTMGADFPNVELVINFLAPDALERWLQRAGRAGRSPKIKICRAILMATRKILADAVKKCRIANINISPELANIKAEDGEAAGEEDAEEQSQNPTTETGNISTRGLYKMTLGMARFLATSGCRTAVLDEEFNNPPHVPCIEFGGCDRCELKRAQQEANKDARATERAAKREEIELAIEFYNGPGEELKHKTRKATNSSDRTGNERKRFKKAIEDWREQKILELLDTIDICKEAFMGDKELLRIACHRGLQTVGDFDDPLVNWQGLTEWRAELLEVIQALERTIQDEADQKAAEEMERQQQQEERRVRALARQQENQRREEEARERRHLEEVARAQRSEQSPASVVPALPFQAAGPSVLGRPVQTIRIRPDGLPALANTPIHSTTIHHGLPSPITPTTPAFSNSYTPVQARIPPLVGITGPSQPVVNQTPSNAAFIFATPIIQSGQASGQSQPPPVSTPSRPRGARTRKKHVPLPGESSFQLDRYPGPGQ